MKDDALHNLLDVFFYGLYMDPDILASRGVTARNPRKASVDGYALRVGLKATLLREEGARTAGLVYSLTPADARALYEGAGLTEYRPETLLAEVRGQGRTPVLCYNLLVPPARDETNPDYEEKLARVKARLGLD